MSNNTNLILELVERMVRVETRMCRLMQALGVSPYDPNPGHVSQPKPEGATQDETAAHDH